MSDVAQLLATPGMEATFVAGPTARSGSLACWRASDLTDIAKSSPQPDLSGTGNRRNTVDSRHQNVAGPLTLVVPRGNGLRRVQVPATWLPLASVIDPLADLGAGTSSAASVHAWAAATRAALHLVARGRLLPAAETDGTDVWRTGPLDRADVAYWTQLAEALPARAHGTELPDTAPRRVASPTWLLARFRDAVADTYVRTSGAPTAAGHDAFASEERQEVVGSTGWLVATGSPATTGVTVSLRVDTGGADPRAEPAEADPDVEFEDERAAAMAETEPVATPQSSADADDAEEDETGFRAVVQIASRRDPSLVLDAAELWAAPASVLGQFGPAAEDEVLLALRRAARAWPPIGRLMLEAQPEALDLSLGEVDELLGPVADALAGSGLDVLWPSGLFATVEVKPTVTSEAPTADRAAGLGFDGLCELGWETTVEGDRLTDQEVRELTEAKRSVVRLRGRWVRADPARLTRARDRRKVTAGAALAAALGGDLLIDGESVAAEVVGPIADLAARLAAAEDRRAVEPSPDLEAELRGYQRDGLNWLSNMADIGFGGILADDMGLGKTIQLLALHLDRRPTAAPTLVVCPVSVLANWEREAARFAPTVPVRRFHGPTRSLDDLPADAIVLTTYGTVRRAADDLAAVPWGLVAADEAQAIKNPLSRTAQAIRTIPAQARFALTGTPVENRLVDLWALLDWTTPGLLGPLERFRHEMAIPVERDQNADAAAALARLVRPFVLRRRKIDPGIAPELPPKTETDHIISLTTEQATLYAAMVDEIMEQVETAEGMARRGLVLKLLSGLKQICNHPAQFLRQRGPLPARSGKLDAAAEMIDTIVAEGESVLVFTQFVTMGHLIRRHVERDDRPVEFLHGSVPLNGRQTMVDRFQAGETPVLVVSLKAGGTGLNLTQATHVIHFDRWWNPAVEDQASDRAWRIGQDRPVQIHRMICEGTVEDRIAQMLTAKRTLADAVVTTGEGWVGELDDDDLRALVALGDTGGYDS